MSSEPKPFQTERQGEVLIIRFTEVSGLATADLHESVCGELDKPEWQDVRCVVVDCSKMEYANSLFLETILDVKHSLDAKDGAVAVAGANDVVREVFHVARLDEIFSFYDSPEEAVSALTG